MGLQYNTYLTSPSRVYGCRKCKTHLSTQEDILSRVCSPRQRARPLLLLHPPRPTPSITKSQLTTPSHLQNFRGQHGKAFLFDNVVNINAGEANERSMTTGRHIVRDISCRQCNETVGWKYDKAFEQAEKYKEGKYILEAELLVQVY